MGRPRNYSDPAAWERTVAEFIKVCKASGDLPTDYNLMSFAGISAATLDRYASGKGAYVGYSRGFDVLKKYRETVFLEKALEAKNPAAAVFALKQASYGGWTDVQQVKQDSTLHVVVGGVGGSDAFK